MSTRYAIHQANMLAWCAEEQARIAAGLVEPYHAALSDFPYLIDFMGRGDRDAPHRAMLRDPEWAAQVADLVRMTGLAKWEAAALIWYKRVALAIAGVLMPGGQLLAFCGDRTDDLLAMALRAAGWVVQTKLMYLYSSGMAHGLDLASKQGTGDPRWAGYGTHLAPAYETVIYAFRPIDGTYGKTAAAYGTAGLNIDACRIAAEPWYKQDGEQGHGHSSGKFMGVAGEGAGHNVNGDRRESDGGRWPKTVMLQHRDECAPAGCSTDCPIAELDRQSGMTKSKASKRGPMVKAPGDSYGASHAKLGEETNTVRGHTDAGGASRFYYTSKVAGWERNAGLDHWPDVMQQRTNPGGLENEPRFAPKPTKNPHPTLKSIRAIAYLARLIKRPDHVAGRLVIPFAGVGSEMCGAHLGGWRDITGVELDQDERYAGMFVPLARDRMAFWTQFPTYEAARAAYKAAHPAAMLVEEREDLAIENLIKQRDAEQPTIAQGSFL